jgi:hypothetical protein
VGGAAGNRRADPADGQHCRLLRRRILTTGLIAPQLLQGVSGSMYSLGTSGFTAATAAMMGMSYGYGLGWDGWLGAQGGNPRLLAANLGRQLWNCLNQFNPNLWNALNKAYTDALARGTATLNPVASTGLSRFDRAVGCVNGVICVDNIWAYIGYGTDALGGLINALTAELVGLVESGFTWLTGVSMPSLADTALLFLV